MHATYAARARPLSTLRAAVDPARVVAWLFPFALTLYLALQGGGYDSIIRDQVGVALWWILLVGSLAGMVAPRALRSSGWLAVAALGLLAVWLAVGITWAESEERAAAELARVATLLAVLAIGLLVARSRRREMLNGVACAIGVVAVVALLSRLVPEAFPANETVRFLPSTRARLSYPLNYWNALAALMALGLPLMLWAASSARTVLARAVAAGALPLLAVTLLLTFSRGGALAAGVGLVASLLLYRERATRIATLALAAGGAALLVAGVAQRPALEDGLASAAARQQGKELLAMVVVVCAGVALLQAAFALVLRHGRRRAVPRAATRAVGASLATLAAVTLVAFAATGGPGWVSDRWAEFKDPGGAAAAERNGRIERFESASGNGRYQYWRSALDAARDEPLRGLGAGSFEFWWARDGTLPGFVRDAHSLYLESAAELGIVGLVLVTLLVLLPLGTAVTRRTRAHADDAALLAAGGGACAAFATSAAVDWVWEVTVLPAAFLLVAAAVLARPAPRDSEGATRSRATQAGTRLTLAAVSVCALLAIGVPLALDTSVRRSQTEAASGRLDAALRQADAGRRALPSAASATLQLALLHEARGDLATARHAAARATRAEPTNWRTWLVRSRLEARAGDAREALRSYRRARSLNPRSPLFAETR